ncbi:MAG: hypothetical protein HY858_13515 [Candidatus Solibacter usitatus]|nr:hypothetical protein [Candidatus Solibacter usitatus]
MELHLKKPAHIPSQRLNLGQLADRFHGEMIPIGTRFRYVCAAVSLSEEDLREYLDEPVAALPPVIAAQLPEIRILLVPYLEKGDPPSARTKDEPLMSTEKPQEARALSFGSLVTGSGAVFAFAVKDAGVADYHYRLYHGIAGLVAGKHGKLVPDGYLALIREELRKGAHGEVDDAAWRLKVDLEEKDRRGARPTKRFRDYALQSYVDTLTLYMHGICCDIDVETGPRQLPSNLLRKRLKFLCDTFPPPQGYAVFPEDL